MKESRPRVENRQCLRTSFQKWQMIGPYSVQFTITVYVTGTFAPMLLFSFNLIMSLHASITAEVCTVSASLHSGVFITIIHYEPTLVLQVSPSVQCNCSTRLLTLSAAREANSPSPRPCPHCVTPRKLIIFLMRARSI